MTELAIAGSVTRTLLSQPNLDIHDPDNGYVLLRDETGPGAMGWRRNTAESAFVHGRYVVSMVKDVVDLSIGIRVRGATHDQLDSRLQALIKAFEQFSYTVTVTIDSVTHSWLCEAADWTIANGQFNGLELYSHTQEIHFHAPRSPIPVAGRF